MCAGSNARMRNNRSVLKEADQPLARLHDLAVLDLDGVLYIGPDAVPGAVEGIRTARALGCRNAYVTNNAARTPGEVAEHLTRLGFEAAAVDVVTSAQAAARVLAGWLDPGAEVYVIGGPGLHRALAQRGLRGVSERTPGIAAVVQGYSPDVPWHQVIDGAILVREGLPWVASNTDLTLPTPAGPGPGNGTLVDLVARFADRDPVVAGKPESPLFEETRERMGANAPIVVGDRLDTDIAGAVRLGWSSLLVLTGVTGLAELVRAPQDQRPDHIGVDLSALSQPQPAPKRHDAGWVLGGWRARVAEGRLVVDGTGPVADWWRVVACASWCHLDETGTSAEIAGVGRPE